MAATPLVSIGLLSYNRPADLRRAMESVVKQTYERLEIIVSDNGSDNPECGETIRHFAAADPRIKPFFHPVNKGPHFSLAFLVEQATGDYFCWLADDDAFSPSFIADCAAVLQTEPGVVMAANMPVVAGTDQMLEPKFIPHTVGLPLADKYALVLDHLNSDINLFYYSLIRLKALRQCHLHLKRLFSSDLLLLPDLLQFGDISVNKGRPGYVYTIHDGQTSASLLRYKSIVTKNGADFIERRAFFTAYIWYLTGIIGRQKALTSGERSRLIRKTLRLYLSSGRCHLIKYDLGISRLTAGIKGLLKGKKQGR